MTHVTWKGIVMGINVYLLCDIMSSHYHVNSNTTCHQLDTNTNTQYLLSDTQTFKKLFKKKKIITG